MHDVYCEDKGNGFFFLHTLQNTLSQFFYKRVKPGLYVINFE